MVDRLSPEARSRLMGRVGSKNTTPELLVRSLAHRLGFRFRLHRSDLPGKPDLVFPRLRKIVFVHGCFWHQHPRCRYGRFPKSRVEFWEEKFRRNKHRDRRALKELRTAGWKVLVVWQCETRNAQQLEALLRDFLDDDGSGQTQSG